MLPAGRLQATACTHLALTPAPRNQYAGPNEGVQAHAVPHSSEHGIHLEGVVGLEAAGQ